VGDSIIFPQDLEETRLSGVGWVLRRLHDYIFAVPKPCNLIGYLELFVRKFLPSLILTAEHSRNNKELL
jgi:hypothetical protein